MNNINVSIQKKADLINYFIICFWFLKVLCRNQ